MLKDYDFLQYLFRLEAFQPGMLHWMEHGYEVIHRLHL